MTNQTRRVSLDSLNRPFPYFTDTIISRHVLRLTKIIKSPKEYFNTIFVDSQHPLSVEVPNYFSPFIPVTFRKWNSLSASLFSKQLLLSIFLQVPNSQTSSSLPFCLITFSSSLKLYTRVF